MENSTGSEEVSIVTVKLAGRLDALEAAPLRQVIADYLDSGQYLLAIDLSEVEFVDSAGLAALVKGMKGARTQGGDLRLVAPSQPDAMRVFELTKFDEVFVMAPDLDSLIASW